MIHPPRRVLDLTFGETVMAFVQGDTIAGALRRIQARGSNTFSDVLREVVANLVRDMVVITDLSNAELDKFVTMERKVGHGVIALTLAELVITVRMAPAIKGTFHCPRIMVWETDPTRFTQRCPSGHRCPTTSTKYACAPGEYAPLSGNTVCTKCEGKWETFLVLKIHSGLTYH